MPFQKRNTQDGNFSQRVMWEQVQRELQRRRRQSLTSYSEWLPQACPELNWTYPHMRYIAEKMDAFSRGEIKRLMIWIPPQHGKLVSSSTPILTANRGWATHGDLKIGDYVFSPNGKPVEIIAESSEDYADIEVEFYNGAKVKVHENHEWQLFDRNCRKWTIVETKQLLSQKQSNRARFFVPRIAPLYYPTRLQTLPPYVVGAWLGDGSSGYGQITHDPNEKEVINEIAKYFPLTSQQIHPQTGVITSYFSGLITLLKEANLYKNKHIPEEYKYCSIEQRLELLAGLIDTDGYGYQDNRWHKGSGRYRIINCNKKLVDDVCEVIRSLGWEPCTTETEPTLSSSGIQGKQVVYQVGFSPDMEIPVRIARKKINCSPAWRRLGIKSVRPCEPEIGKCVQVDSEDGLYLVGKELIPTHNSSVVTVRYPVFLLEKNPATRIIVTGYGADLAESFSKQIRAIVRARNIVELDQETQSVPKWLTKQGGGIKAIGVEGAVTGFSGDVIIIDDPVKNREAANSKATREATWNWFTNDLYTRQQADTPIVVIQTRWHEDDLSGRLLEDNENSDPEYRWTVVSLPAICEGTDPADYPVQREVGEALCEDLHPIKQLRELERKLGSDFAALYQQRPAPAEGDVWKKAWFCEGGEPDKPLMTVNKFPANKKITQVWDTSLETKERNDPNAMVEGCLGDDGFYYIAAMVNEKMEFPQLVHRMRSESERYDVAEICVEDKANAKPARQQLKLLGVPLIEIPTGGNDKHVRAKSVTHYAEAGLIRFVNVPGNCNNILFDQLMVFDNGKHDDLHDAFVHLLRRLCKKNDGWSAETLKEIAASVR